MQIYRLMGCEGFFGLLGVLECGPGGDFVVLFLLELLGSYGKKRSVGRCGTKGRMWRGFLCVEHRVRRGRGFLSRTSSLVEPVSLV